MPQLTADWIYHPQGLLQDHLLELSEQGEVLALRPLRSSDQATYHPGILSPGFVNAHCHLELSMLRGQISQGTGMVDFVGQVVRKRGEFEEDTQRNAARQAMAEMQASGTVAVGDISNSPLTASLKRSESAIRSHTFVELLGLRPEQAAQIIANGQQTLAAFSGLSASLSPHAPYSMSAALLQQLYQTRQDRMSIHLLESRAERELFDQQSGDFLAFFAALQLPPPPYPAGGAVAHVLGSTTHSQSYLFVHLTEAQPTELAQLIQQVPQAFLCLCPLSNLFIHNRFPRIEQFLPYTDRICLGTDSLASNKELDIWAEIQAIKRRYPSLAWHILLTWATGNGARALGFAAELGDFQVGKRPGVLQVQPERESGAVRRLY